MGVKGYGGSGFLAKEVVQDLVNSPVLSEFGPDEQWRSICFDVDVWCCIGPGARRGWNRLHGRQLNQNVWSNSPKHQEAFLEETIAIFQERKNMWPELILGQPSICLTLHDIQFQLCEYDKYERVRLREGQARKYKNAF